MLREILMFIPDYTIPSIKGKRDARKYSDSIEKLEQQTWTHLGQEEAKFGRQEAFKESRTAQKLLPLKKAISPHERDHEKFEQAMRVENAKIEVEDGITDEEKYIMKENAENFVFTFNSRGQKEFLDKYTIQKNKDPWVFRANKILEREYEELKKLKSRLDLRLANYQRSVNRWAVGYEIEVKTKIKIQPPLYWDRNEIFSSNPERYINREETSDHDSRNENRGSVTAEIRSSIYEKAS